MAGLEELLDNCCLRRFQSSNPRTASVQLQGIQELLQTRKHLIQGKTKHPRAYIKIKTRKVDDLTST